MITLKSTWHHIRRSPFQSLAAILIMFMSFFILSAFLIVNNGLTTLLNYFESKPEVTIFLKDGLDKNTVENIQKELAAYPTVKEIKFISKEKALTLYKEMNKDNPMLLEMVTASILPASFEVSVADPKVLENIASNFSSRTKEVDEIIYQKDVINLLLTWTSNIRKLGIFVVATTSGIACLIIFVIITMKITSRKEEVKISRLLGASRAYVQAPFLLEGLFYGLVGSILGIVASISLFFATANQLNNYFQPIIFVDQDPVFYLILSVIIVSTGSLLGLISSFLGVVRYIKF